MNAAVAIIDPFGSGVHLKQAAIEEGYSVIGVFTIPMDVAEKAYRGTKDYFFSGCSQVIESSDREEILKKLSESAYLIKGVMPGIDSGVELADELASKMGLIGNSLLTSSMRRDKLAMRRGLAQAGLSTPAFESCSMLSELETFAKAHSYPLVVKTPRGAGSQNVFICEDWNTLKEGFETIISSPNAFGSQSPSALVEEYVGGDEYVVDLFCDGTKAHVTDVWVYTKGLPGGPKNLCWNCDSIDPNSVAELVEYTQKAAIALGINWGPAHAEVKYDPVKGPTLIEIGARLSGAGLPILIRKASNFDLFTGVLDIYTKGKANVPKEIQLDKSFSIAFGPVFQEGIVTQISGIEEIQKLPSYLKHSLYLKVGDRCEKSIDLFTTPLVVYLGHRDPDQVKRDIQTIHQIFHASVK